MMDSAEWGRVLGADNRSYMTEADVGTAADEPRPMIIQVDAMTVAQARAAPKALREVGVVGGMVFTGGDIAEKMKELAMLRRRLRKGGEADGSETVHQA